MTKDSGSSKKLIIAGVVIFIVLIATVLFSLFGTISPDDADQGDQFVDFPVSPPNDIFSEPTVEVVVDNIPINQPRQENAPDQIRGAVIPVAAATGPEVDQAELDALAFLNSQPRPTDNVSAGGSAGSNTSNDRDRFTLDELNAALEADPDSIFLDEEMANFFEGWRPPTNIQESFDQLTNQSWALEDRVDMDEITGAADDQQIFDITDQEIKSCGQINITTNADASPSQLASALSRDSAALCIGQEIVGSCKPTSVVTGGITYLAGDFGNGCAAGVMAGGFANLCVIQLDPDTAGSGSNQDLGRLLVNVFTTPSVANCAIHQY